MGPRTERPNILFIMADQHRHDCLGSAPPGFVRTPNLDRLADRGVRFETCCTNSPVSAPARIGLATGLQPSRLGALDNGAYLPVSVPTYYQRLRDRGYRVGCVGKLDLAKPDPYNGRFGDRPCAYGWGFTHPEECEGKMHAGSSPTPIGPYTYWLEEKGLLRKFHEDYSHRKRKGWHSPEACGDSVLPADAFEDAYIGRRAAEWIRNVPDDFPWHYFVSFVGPHDPFDPPTEYADRCRARGMPPPVPRAPEGHHAYLRRSRELDPAGVLATRRQYCGAIEVIDDQVGMIMDALEERGRLESTYVLFSSDHGEMLGDHGMYAKEVPYEASLRVPLIAAGPGIEGGRASGALVELSDVNPTICEFAGLPPQERIDAESFAPVLRGERADHRTECVSVHRHFRLIRTGRCKLIQNWDGAFELYDLDEDPGEQRNVAGERRDVVREMQRRLKGRCLEGKWLR